jgi:hypothetical protein
MGKWQSSTNVFESTGVELVKKDKDGQIEAIAEEEETMSPNSPIRALKGMVVNTYKPAVNMKINMD